MIQSGEINLADSEHAGRHPVIVLSREDLNGGAACFYGRVLARVHGVPECRCRSYDRM
jgi:hypothetical protein